MSYLGTKPQTATEVADGVVTPSDLSTGHPTWDTSGNLTLDNGAADGAQLVLKSAGYSNWNIDNYSGSLRAYYNATEYMRLDSSGNLGLNVAPSPWTDFKGIQIGQRFSAVSEGTVADLYLNSYYASGSYRYIANGYATQYRQQDGNHIFYNAASGTAGNSFSYTEQMRINSSGYVGIGTSSPSSRLHVEKNDGGDIDLFTAKRTADNTGAIHRIIAGATTPSYLFYIVAQLSGGTVKFQVAGNGNVTNANNSYGGISDIKLKENIVDATPKLEDLCKVKVRQYNLKSEPENKQIGVVAQELEEVFAGLVEETIDTDVDGNNLGTTTKSVKYSVFVPMLIKAIQEQQAIITSLEARLTALESK